MLVAFGLASLFFLVFKKTFMMERLVGRGFVWCRVESHKHLKEKYVRVLESMQKHANTFVCFTFSFRQPE